MKKVFALLFFLLLFGRSTSNSSPTATDSFRSRVPNATELQELLPVVCKGEWMIDRQDSTCNPCPFDRTSDMNKNFLWKQKVETVLYGHFLSANETNAIVDTSLCEPYTSNYGGTAILRWKGSQKWEYVRYESGNRSNDCLKYKANAGHDLRVCRVSLESFNPLKVQRFDSFNNTLPFTKNPSSVGEQLVQITSNFKDCNNPKVNEFQVIRSERKDLNRDGRPDFRLQISERHGQRIKTGDCEEKIQWGKTKTLTLEFLFDGTQFKATPATKPLVKYLNSFKSQ
jgi:hypothetical protein